MPSKPHMALHAERVAAYEQAVSEGFLPQGVRTYPGSPRTAILVAAERLGVHLNTMKDSLRTARVAGLQMKVPDSTLDMQPENSVDARSHRLDADYWRKKAKKAEEALAGAEADLRVARGLTSRPAEPPKWTLPSHGGRRNKVMGLLHVSDIHNGEVVRRAEIHGVNEYSPEVMQKRVRRLFSAFCEVVPRWAADSALVGAVVAVNGDLVSGDIHDELRRTNASSAFEQAFLVADELAAGVEHVANAFGSVLVTFTPGNHGRTTEKTHAKRVSSLSYDMLIGEIVRRHFAKDRNVTVLLADGPDLEFSVLGLKVFQSHGDALGTGGGKGFAGPVLPIARGAKNVELQAYRMRKRHDVILTAHYHTSSNPARGVFANGSVVGYNEFANRIRAGIEPPQQWAVLLHEKWGVRERCEIVLDEVGALTTDVG